MTGFLIALGLVVLAVLGPVLVFRPTPRQKQLERLRRSAIAAGLQVRVAERAADGTPEAEYVLAWRLRGAGRLRSLRMVIDRDEQGGCRISSPARGEQPVTDAELTDIFAPLHPCCRQIRVARDGLSVLWAERGDEDRVSAIRDALGALSVLLAERCSAAVDSDDPDAGF